MASLSPGQLLEGKYQIIREIARGAMGVVHEALHVALGRRVAIKTLLAGTEPDPELAARFEREARAASAIGHPHIIDVFDLGRTPEGLLFMAMELLDGRPLSTLLQKTPCLQISLAIDLASQMLGGLAAAHRNGIIHRDLKPENIFILNNEDRPNFVKIVDFGISKILARSAHAQRTAGQGTAVGTVMGTPLYMSPEQILGQVGRIDHRSDIYSAGVVLYEMLCGCTPFEGESQAKIFASILDGWFPLPHDLRRDIPPNVEAAILRALDRDMEKRFDTATAMREAILGRSVDVTPSPELVSDLFASGPTTVRQPSALDRADPFAPLPDQAPIPLLPRASERPLAEEPRTASASIELARPARASSAVMPRGQASQEFARPSRLWPRLAMALGLIALIVGARVVSIYLRPSADKSTQVSQRQHKVTLALDPADAVVQIDLLPVMREDLFLDQDKPHVLYATAPGRISRRFSIDAKTDLDLSVSLGRTLALPSPADPEPSPSELSVRYSANPAARDEISRAFVKLDHYARCLTLLGFGDTEARKGGHAAVPSNSDMSGCVQLLDEANALAPMMFHLHSAGVAYLQGVQNGQSPAALHKLLAAFRAEFLATRTDWQMTELARQEKDEGRTGAWHMRRVTLAAQAWLRQNKAGAENARGLRGPSDSRAKLDQAHQALLEFVQRAPKPVTQIFGIDEFLKSAENAVALAKGEPGKKYESAATLAACRQLVTAFNTLIVD
jgi:serine/threonine protein kinase